MPLFFRMLGNRSSRANGREVRSAPPYGAGYLHTDALRRELRELESLLNRTDAEPTEELRQALRRHRSISRRATLYQNWSTTTSQEGTL